MVDKRVLKGTEFWVREIPRSGSEYARVFARPPERVGPNSGVHFNPGLLLNLSERMAGVKVLTFEYWLWVLLPGLEK